MSDLRKAAEMALRVLYLGDNEVVPDNYNKIIGEAIRRLEMVLSESSKLEWFPAPTKTEWGENMVCAAVNIDDNHYFDVYCEEWQKENVELMLGVTKREWVGLTVDEVIDVNDQVLKFLSETFKNPGYAEYSGALWRAIEAKLKEKNGG